METVAYTIHLSRDVGAVLEEKALADGKNVEEYVEYLIGRDIDERKAIDKILEPAREMFENQPLSDEELDELIETERQAVWEENHGNAQR